MNHKMIHARRWGIAAGILYLVFTLSACGINPAPAASAPAVPGTKEVDAVFREYYRDLGGEVVLGPAISTAFRYDNRTCQYTESAMMCHDPAATGAGRFRLEPLGKQMGIFDEPEEGTAAMMSSRIVDDYPIYPGFIAMYDVLKGEANLGKLLTGPRYNYEYQRVEQYFENLGFYTSFNDPASTVSTIPYGVVFCGQDCTFQTDYKQRYYPGKQEIATPFAEYLQSLGGMAVFGQPLTRPYETKDGKQTEQVYENVVVYANSKKMDEVKFRSLPVTLGLMTSAPQEQIYGEAQNVTFYKVKDDLGYHVPLVFDKYIQQHGGKEVAGQPIGETLYYEPELPRQCFRNYCLDYHQGAPAHLQVRPAPLGLKYLEQVKQDAVAGYAVPASDVVILLQKEKTQVNPKDTQTIQIQVVDKKDKKPLSNVQTKLTLMTPDGSEFAYYPPATGVDGRSGVVLPPMPKQPGGSLIVYRVCVEIAGSSPVCERDAYLIWTSE